MSAAGESNPPKPKRAKATKAPKAPAEEPPTCPVCIAPYTGTLRRPVHCSACGGETCSKCVEAYLLNIVDDPHCPHCKAQWNRAFLATACTKTYMQNAYMKKRQALLFERERSFFPQYQVTAERELRARTFEKERDVLREETWRLRREVGDRLAEIRKELEREYERVRKVLYEDVVEKETYLNRLELRIERIREGVEVPEEEDGKGEGEGGAGAGAGAEAKSKREVAKFVRRCTVEGCNGFLSSVWKCGLCSNWVCPDCFEVKGTEKNAEHTCKPDMLETAKLIKKDTKPCPECGELIQKGSGCDQMWCISCHTPFSWETGKRVTSGVIHNPHYFQWLAQGGRGVPQNPGHIPCGGLPDPGYMAEALRHVPRTIRSPLMASLRCCLDVQDVQRNRYTAHIHPPNNEDLGVRFLIKDLTEESYKSMLARKESDRLKSAEIRAALDAFLGASIDLFRRIDVDKTYTKVEGEAIASEVFKELEALRTFIGDALLGIGRSFDCSVPYIQESWYVDHGKPSTLLRRQRELAIQLLAYRQEEAAALAERDARRAEYLTAKALQDEALRTLQNLQASILALEAENRAKRKAGEAVSADITALLKRQRAEVKDAEEIARTLNEQAWAAHHAFDAAELRMQRARYYN